MKNIESSTSVLKNVLDELQAGKGLAGNLLKNEQLAATVSQIANNLSITSSNLNRLGLWGILFLAPKLPSFFQHMHDIFGPIPLLGRVFGGPPYSGRSFFTAGVILAVMITPIITLAEPHSAQRSPGRRPVQGADGPQGPERGPR